MARVCPGVEKLGNPGLWGLVACLGSVHSVRFGGLTAFCFFECTYFGSMKKNVLF